MHPPHISATHTVPLGQVATLQGATRQLARGLPKGQMSVDDRLVLVNWAGASWLTVSVLFRGCSGVCWVLPWRVGKQTAPQPPQLVSTQYVLTAQVVKAQAEALHWTAGLSGGQGGPVTCGLVPSTAAVGAPSTAL